jgi:predicted DNA-binding transcriptional regulator AlpA
MKDDLGKAHRPQSGHESELLTPKEAAAFIKMSESFLAKARMRGDGPRYRKLSRSVRYDKADLLLWLKASAKTSTAERDPRQEQERR